MQSNNLALVHISNSFKHVIKVYEMFGFPLHSFVHCVVCCKQVCSTLCIIRRYFSQEGVRDEPLYGVVDVSHEIDEDKVYGRLVDLRPGNRVSIRCKLIVSISTVNFLTALFMSFNGNKSGKVFDVANSN